MWSSVLAGLVLFWPAMMSLFLLGFLCIVLAVFFVGSTVLVVSIFLYGLYCILRDMGLLDPILQRIGVVTNLLSEHVKKNVEDSFVFETLTDPVKGPALYICHPHGLYGLTWFIHFATALSKWPFERRPVLAVHSVFFQLPLFRELFKLNSCIEASESEIIRCLQDGRSVALLVGGIEELHLTGEGPLQLILKKRKGYIRISQECKVPLVPLVSPQENTLFPSLRTPLWNWLQQQLYKRVGLALPLPSFSSLGTWMGIAYKPFAKRLVTFVLEPVNPDGKSFEEIQTEYIDRLQTFSIKRGVPIEFRG